MTRSTKTRWLVMVALMVAGLVSLVGASGCDDYVAAGDFYSPSVEPMDFSPYGYDYSMYDIFTSDI